MSIKQRKEVKKRSYQVDFYIKVDGKRKRIRKGGFDTREDGKRYEREVLAQCEAGKWNSKNKRGTTFAELAKIYTEKYCRRKRSWKSDLSRLKKLVEYFGDYYIAELNKLHVSEYIEGRRNEYTVRHKLVSGTTINRELELLRRLMNLSVEWELLLVNKIKEFGDYLFDEAEKTNVLPRDMLDRLVEMAPFHLKIMILIGLNTGMRRGEILNLEWSRVNFDTNEIHIPKTKTFKERYVTMNETIKSILLYLKKRSVGGKYVIENPKTGRCYVEIKRAWKSLLRSVGLTEFRFHDLRHNFASHTKKGNLVTLKDALGHKNIAMTARYAHTMDGEMSNLVNSFQIGSEINPEELLKKK